MRLSVTDLQSKCACHRDKHNSFNPAFSAVVGMLVIWTVGGKEKRIAINAQAQKSVDECLACSQLYWLLISMILSEYARMPESRKVVSPALLRGQDRGGVEGGMAGFRCIRNPCNMDPMSFYQPFIHYTVLLVDRFGLSFPETVRLMAAIEILPNTSYYFAAAA
jgi:hypothetical protein